MYTAAEFQNAIPERLDRLPLSRTTWRIMLLVGVAWLIESYDIGIIGNALPLLAAQYHLDSFTKGLLSTISTLGIVVAILPSGWLADRVGRKRILVFGTIWYALFSLLCGFAPNIPTLIGLRFLAGIGMGAVFPIPYTMAAEIISQRFRGIMTAVLDSFLSVGYFLAPVCAFILSSQSATQQGWRVLFLIGGLPLLYVPALLAWLPESPRWLQTQGRIKEAHNVVLQLETNVERATGTSLPTLHIVPARSSAAPVRSTSSIKDLFNRTYRKRTGMMWVAFACILFIFYAVQTYTPSVLVQQGYGIGNAFLFTSIIVIASIPGKYCAGFAMENIGRKRTLIIFTLLAALCALLFGISHNVVLALISGCLLSFFGIGVDPVIKIYGAEQYPTAIRETGSSTFEGVGRFFGGVLAPFIMSFTLSNVGILGSYLFVAAISGIGVLAVLFFGNETKGKLVEDVVIEDIAA
jgi:Sugar phosphate permease